MGGHPGIHCVLSTQNDIRSVSGDEVRGGGVDEGLDYSYIYMRGRLVSPVERLGRQMLDERIHNSRVVSIL